MNRIDSRRKPRGAALVIVAVVALVVPNTVALAYTQNAYNASYNTMQTSSCWCVVASAITWLKYVSGSTIPSQSTLSSEMTETPWDKYPMQTGSCLHNGQTTYGHDSRGWAWGMYAYTPGGYFFNDYKRAKTVSGGRSWMNWEFVFGIRADGNPVGAIVEGGAHAIDIVGYKTNYDPFSNHVLVLNGFYIFDPWFGRGNSGLPNWGVGFQPNHYFTIAEWNTHFTPDHVNGAFWHDTYNGVLRAYPPGTPSNTEPETYGDHMYSLAQGAAPDPASLDEASLDAASTVESAIQTGLESNDLESGDGLGIDLVGYSVGNSVRVQSLVDQIPSYRLVELRVEHVVRAIVLVSEREDGYVFGAIAPVVRLPGYMSEAGRADAIEAAGLDGPGELVWAPTRSGATPFLPFIRGIDSKSGHQAYLTVQGLEASIALTVD